MPSHGGKKEVDLSLTLDPKRIHDCKKEYPAVVVQQELATLNRKLYEKNVKVVQVLGSGKNGSKIKMDYCEALVTARRRILLCKNEVEKSKSRPKGKLSIVEKRLETPQRRMTPVQSMTTVDRFFASNLKLSQMKSEVRIRKTLFGPLEIVEVEDADEDDDGNSPLEARIYSEMEWDRDFGDLLKSLASPILQVP